MKRFIKYPSIEQFRTTVKNVKHSAMYQGIDADGNPIMDRAARMPKITAVGTEKIHGTNASVCYSNRLGFWVQKRTSIVTSEADNAGCACAAECHQSVWVDIIKDLAIEHEIDLDDNIITVYYEWCGENIQKLSAVSTMEKMAIIFRHFKVSPVTPDETVRSYWLETTVEGEPIDDPRARIYNILSFPTYEVEIDFNEPELAQNEMQKLVEEIVEPNSPVGKQLGVDGNVGEGIVFSFAFKYTMYQFKVKGEKHSNSRVKTLKPVDTVRLQKINDLAQKVCTSSRLEQMYDLANDVINGGTGDIRNLGSFLKMVANDIIKEESDIIAEAGFEPKDIFKAVPKISRQWYQDQLDREIMG